MERKAGQRSEVFREGLLGCRFSLWMGARKWLAVALNLLYIAGWISTCDHPACFLGVAIIDAHHHTQPP